MSDTTAVIVQPAPSNGTALATPMQLLQIALQNNAAIDVIERLAALQDKFMARDAEIDFNESMSRVQEKIERVAPDLVNPSTSSKYASYAAIDRKIRPIYSKEGFSLSFDTTDCPKPDHVRVICYVAKRGFVRRYQMDMSADGKGAKGGSVMTPTHAEGAAMSYGMRYLVRGIFNIAIGQEDTDGNLSNADLLPADKVTEQVGWIQNARSLDELKKLFAAAYREADAAGDKSAQAVYMRAKDKRKKELL